MDFLLAQSNVVFTTFKPLNKFVEFVGVLNVQRRKIYNLLSISNL